MRLGKIEIKILTLLGQLLGIDYFITRELIRRRVGYDPDEIALFHVRRILAEKPNVDVKKLTMKIKNLNAIKSLQVSFSRALHRLIEKNLVRRSWEVCIETGIIGKQMYTDIGHWSDNGKVIVDLLSYPYNYDIPKCDVKVKCFFHVTPKGRFELEKRGIATFYAQAIG